MLTVFFVISYLFILFFCFVYFVLNSPPAIPMIPIQPHIHIHFSMHTYTYIHIYALSCVHMHTHMSIYGPSNIHMSHTSAFSALMISPLVHPPAQARTDGRPAQTINRALPANSGFPLVLLLWCKPALRNTPHHHNTLKQLDKALKAVALVTRCVEGSGSEHAENIWFDSRMSANMEKFIRWELQWVEIPLEEVRLDVADFKGKATLTNALGPLVLAKHGNVALRAGDHETTLAECVAYHACYIFFCIYLGLQPASTNT